MKPVRLKRPALIAVLALAGCYFVPAASAEQSVDDEKAKAEEVVDLAEATQKPSRLTATVKLLEKPDPRHPEIVGTVSVDKVSYQLYIADMEIQKAVKKLDNKQVTMMGVYTNKGTCFSCVSLVTNPGGGPQPARGKRGGL